MFCACVWVLETTIHNKSNHFKKYLLCSTFADCLATARWAFRIYPPEFSGKARQCFHRQKVKSHKVGRRVRHPWTRRRLRCPNTFPLLSWHLLLSQFTAVRLHRIPSDNEFFTHCNNLIISKYASPLLSWWRCIGLNKLNFPHQRKWGFQATQTIILPKAMANTNADIKFLRLWRRKIEFGEQHKTEK